jgi:transcription elongation factor GreA
MSTMAAGLRNHEVALTRAGYERVRHELATLIATSRPAIRNRLRDAREQGGELADNLELTDALEDHEMLERRITNLEASLASALIVDDPPRDGTIGIGTQVRIHAIDSGQTAEYDIVGSIEADPAQARLSADSPVGRALLGRRTGDVLQVETPRGEMRFRILAVGSGRPSAPRPSAGHRRARAAGWSGVGREALASAR